MHAGQVEAVLQELAYRPEPLEVVLAIETGPTLAAGGRDETSSLVEPEILGSVPTRPAATEIPYTPRDGSGPACRAMRISPIDRG